jgi:hypothetical protein
MQRCYRVHQRWTGSLTGLPEVRREGQEMCSSPDKLRGGPEYARDDQEVRSRGTDPRRGPEYVRSTSELFCIA